MIKAIIFDMGGVILISKIESGYKKLSELLNISYEDFKEIYNLHHEDMQKGKLKVKDFIDIIKNKFNINKDIIKLWKKTYLEIMKVNQVLLDLINNLRKNYKILLLSNAPDLHYEINKERKILSYFDDVIISCQVGLIKPEKEIFNLTLEKLKLNPEECIFIDDREEHIVPAKEMRFRTILYRDNQQLINELKELNIL